jgi:hypothetical protein
MFKMKLLVVVGILSLVGIVLNSSPHFSISAETDVAKEIEKYKTWTRVTKEPFKVRSYFSTLPAV